MLRQFLFTCFLSFIIALPARAVIVLPLSLDEIVSLSAIAFQGNIIESKIDRDPQTNLMVTYITFKVKEVLKGEVGAAYIIKQFIAHEDAYPPAGVSKLMEGKSNIYFLTGVSRNGFSSAFRAFQIVLDAKVLSDFSPPSSERNIVIGLPPSVGLEYIGLEEFKQLVRQKVGM